VGQGKDSPYLTGKLLLAMPGMGDPRFDRAVILVCSHDETGAMGLVVNHTMPGIVFDELIEQLKIETELNFDFSDMDLPVMNGGPVEMARGFILHSADFNREETVPIDADFSVTGTVEALKDVAAGQGPDHMLLILGYAGWTAGQLDQEMQKNAWLVVDPLPGIIFHEHPEEKWQMAVRHLGIDPGMLNANAGRA
jgi:putative transcriptional regulator